MPFLDFLALPCLASAAVLLAVQLAEVTAKVRKSLDENGFPESTPVIATSAKSRQGRVELLGYLRLVFDVDRRKGKGAAAAASAGGAPVAKALQ